MKKSLSILLLFVVFISMRAQDTTKLAPYTAQVRALAAEPQMKSSFDFVDRNRDAILREWTTGA